MAGAGGDTRGMTVAEAAAPSSIEVLAQLDRILSHPEFSRSERGRNFLRYIVEETVAGRADRIKAYSVALAVFGRGASFDAQADPVVRIEAGRLRRVLERYYLVVGQRDPILIDVPKGAYVPVFTGNTDPAPAPAEPLERPPAPSTVAAFGAAPDYSSWRMRLLVAAVLAALASSALLAGILLWPTTLSRAESPAAPEKPKLLVLPFSDTSETAEGKIYAAGFADEIINQLSTFKELTILGHETSKGVGYEPDIDRIRNELGVRYVVKGSVRISGGQARVTDAQAREEFLRLRPTFFEHLEAELAKRNFRPEDQAVLVEGARKAGFPVPARLLQSRD